MEKNSQKQKVYNQIKEIITPTSQGPENIEEDMQDIRENLFDNQNMNSLINQNNPKEEITQNNIIKNKQNYISQNNKNSETLVNYQNNNEQIMNEQNINDLINQQTHSIKEEMLIHSQMNQMGNNLEIINNYINIYNP